MRNRMEEPNFQLIETNGVRLCTVVVGSGPLVILLDGFPQCWYLWRHQITPFPAAGRGRGRTLSRDSEIAADDLLHDL